MTIQLPENKLFQSVSPSKNEQQIAKISAQKLRTAIHEKLRFGFNVEEELIAIPESAVVMLHQILSQMALGNPVVMIPAHAELTTQEAADTLNVSRPYLVKLLEDGKLTFRKVGSHRRILFSDLMEYKEKVKIDRLNVLEELQKDAEDNDMGY